MKKGEWEILRDFLRYIPIPYLPLMTRSIGLWLILGLLISCNTPPSQSSGQRELVPDPEKYEHDGYDPETISFIPDTTIGPIKLLDTSKVLSFLGEDIMDRLEENESLGLPHTRVLSSDGKQQLTVIFHPGNVTHEFSEFEVAYPAEDRQQKYRVSEQEFITESGIKLGMTLGALKSIKGEPDTVVQGEEILFKYIIEEGDSRFLARYYMPLYYAYYTFDNGYLISAKFGFEYP